MALTFLVDTSVIKRLGQPPVRQVVEPLAVAGDLARARITDLEVGYSARNDVEWDRLIGALGAFEIVETTAPSPGASGSTATRSTKPARPEDTRPAYCDRW